MTRKNFGKDNEPDNPQSSSIFERYIDVYMNAAVWGIYYRRKSKLESLNNKSDRARIYADAFSRNRDECIFLYRLIMLLDNSENILTTERMDSAFRYDTLPDKADGLIILSLKTFSS